jgi:DHA3 family macrolide efflux protein-like MFS transporter
MPPILRPLATGRIAWLWGGLALSGIGDQLFLVVLGWLAVRTFGTDAGLLTSVQAAVSLLTALLAGRVTDAFAHRTALIGADLMRAVVLAGMVAVWLAMGDPPGWALVAAVLALAVGNSVFRPALIAVIPELAPVQLLPATNALFDTTERIARLLGPGLIGVLGAALPLVHFVTIDVVSFLASATAVSFAVPVRAHVPPEHLRQGIWPTLSRGFVAIRRHRLLGFTLFSSGVVNGVWMVSYFIGLPLMLVQGGVAGGIGAFGLVISAYGLTNLASTLVVGNRPISRRPGRMIFGGNIVFGTGVLLLGLAGLLPGTVMLAGLMGAAMVSAIGGPMHDITNATLRQTVLGAADIAAGARAFLVITQSGLLVGLLISPLLFREIGVPGTVILGGLTVIFVSFAGLFRFGRDGA